MQEKSFFHRSIIRMRRQDAREKFKGGRRFLLMMEERGAGFFETITSSSRSRKNSDWVLSQKKPREK